MRGKVVYIDMDNVLVDFRSGIDALGPEERETYKGAYDNCPHIFAKMMPVKGAIESFKRLSESYDVYIPLDLPVGQPYGPKR